MISWQRKLYFQVFTVYPKKRLCSIQITHQFLLPIPFLDKWGSPTPQVSSPEIVPDPMPLGHPLRSSVMSRIQSIMMALLEYAVQQRAAELLEG